MSSFWFLMKEIRRNSSGNFFTNSQSRSEACSKGNKSNFRWTIKTHSLNEEQHLKRGLNHILGFVDDWISAHIVLHLTKKMPKRGLVDIKMCNSTWFRNKNTQQSVSFVSGSTQTLRHTTTFSLVLCPADHLEAGVHAELHGEQLQHKITKTHPGARGLSECCSQPKVSLSPETLLFLLEEH